MKFWLFRYYGWLIAIGVVVVIILGAFGVFGTTTDQWQITFTGVGALLSLAYFVQKQKLDEARLFKELFQELNARYREMVGEMASIVECPDEQPLDAREKKVLKAYFNLCGEEYLMYDKGYIYPAVWTSWRRGMLTYYDNPRIRPYWDNEFKSGSYYGLTLR